MIEIKDKSKCCGCNACMNVCPKQAISMVDDEKGFKYPKIDSNKCVNCDLCEEICPELNNRKENINNINSYACYNNNLEERLNSSSGGIFVLLAKKIIKKYGVVFGASFDTKFNVVHSYVDNKKNVKNS